MASYDRVVVLLNQEDYPLLGGTAAAFAPSKRVVFVRVPAYWSGTVAHELVHTMPYPPVWSSDQMVIACDIDYHNELTVAHGHQITSSGKEAARRRWKGRDHVMGPEGVTGWISQCTYWHLTELLQGGPPDPPVILVQGFISRLEGTFRGLLEPLYQFDSFTDLEAGVVMPTLLSRLDSQAHLRLFNVDPI